MRVIEESLMVPMLKKLLHRVIENTLWPRNFLYCSYRGITLNPTWTFYGLPIITQKKRGSIKIGDRLTACSRAQNNSLGVIQPVIIRALTDVASVRIGDDVGMSGCTISARNSISIGSHVLIGTGVIITDNDAHPLQAHQRQDLSKIASSPVKIGDSVFIGARAMILKGVEIGDCAVIGAGSVVTRSVARNTIVAGNPATRIAEISGPKDPRSSN